MCHWKRWVSKHSPDHEWGNDIDALSNASDVDDVSVPDEDVQPGCHSERVGKVVKLFEAILGRACGTM